MSKLINLREIERKAYMTFFEDGLADLLIGLFVLGIGLLMYSDQVAIISILPLLCLSLWWLLKRFITIPRIGVVNLSQDHKTRLFKRKGAFTLLLGIAFFVNILFFMFAQNSMPDLKAFMSQYVDIFFSFLVAMFIFVGGLLSGVTRWLVHAGIVMFVAFAGESLAVELPLRLLVSGIIIFLVGLGILVQFIRHNPVPEQEV